jgi:hypothetical protein
MDVNIDESRNDDAIAKVNQLDSGYQFRLLARRDRKNGAIPDEDYSIIDAFAWSV